jgi:hypothetical protein
LITEFTVMLTVPEGAVEPAQKLAASAVFQTLGEAARVEDAAQNEEVMSQVPLEGVLNALLSQ